MWSVSLKHYKCKEDSSGSYIIHDGRLRAGYARVVTRQGVEWRKMTKNTWQYFEDEADYRLLLVSMQVSIIILILRAESPILPKRMNFRKSFMGWGGIFNPPIHVAYFGPLNKLEILLVGSEL